MHQKMNVAMIRKSFQVRVTGPIREEGIQELLSSIPDIQWYWIEKTDSELRVEVRQRLCLKNDGEKKQWRVIVS